MSEITDDRYWPAKILAVLSTTRFSILAAQNPQIITFTIINAKNVIKCMLPGEQSQIFKVKLSAQETKFLVRPSVTYFIS